MIIPINNLDWLVTFNTPNWWLDVVEWVEWWAIKFYMYDWSTGFFYYNWKHLISYKQDVIVWPLIDWLFTTVAKSSKKMEVIDINNLEVLISSHTDKFIVHPGRIIEIQNYSDLRHQLINIDTWIKSNIFNEFIIWSNVKNPRFIIGFNNNDKCTLLFPIKDWWFEEIDNIDWLKIKVPSTNWKRRNTDWCYLYDNNSQFIYDESDIKKQWLMNLKTGFKLIRDDYEFLNFKNTDLDWEWRDFESEWNLIKVYYLKNKEPYVMIIDENWKVLFDEDYRDYNIAGVHDYDRIQIKDWYWLAIETVSDGDTEFNDALCDEDDIFKPNVRLITPEWNKIDIIDELNSNGIIMDDDWLSKLTIDFVKDWVVCLRKRVDDLVFVFFTTDGKYINDSLKDHLVKINGNYSNIKDICVLPNGHLLIDSAAGDCKIISLPFKDVFANLKELDKWFYELDWKTYLNTSFDKKLDKESTLINDNINRFLNNAKEVNIIDDKTIEINSRKFNKKLVKLK